ncbi:MAG: KpsF/GutQ family sugar-phosphate isomerase [Bacteroidetes bacterium]|nr:KpsF/GutQ family sugar-phosphate isomerase [Bacteroidota bacterium]
MTTTSIQEAAIRTLQLEAESIAHLQQYINESFVKAVQTIAASKGRVVISGIGKSGIVAQKIVATLNSTGTASIFMHAADAIHGDLGMVQDQDIVMIISKSGESPEIKVLLPLVKNFGNTLIGIVGNDQSLLAKQSDIFLNTTVSQEACPNNLAPTSSTTAQMAMGDALAVALMEIRGFNSDDFAKLHPGGSLGKRLYLRVQDLYLHNEKPKVKADTALKEVIMEMTSKRLGATAVIDEKNILLGIITDGDLRRMLEKNVVTANVIAKDIMSLHPKTIDADALAVEALDVLRTNDISQLVVISGGEYKGFLHLHDLIREGII